MPGRIMNTPEYFRVSLTASDAMVEKALPAFEAITRARRSANR
jgi:aspartate aminotransferase